MISRGLNRIVKVEKLMVRFWYEPCMVRTRNPPDHKCLESLDFNGLWFNESIESVDC